MNEHKTLNADCCGTYWLPSISTVTPLCRSLQLFLFSFWTVKRHLKISRLQEQSDTNQWKWIHVVSYWRKYTEQHSGISIQITAFVGYVFNKILVLDIWTVTNYIPFRISCQTCSHIKRKFMEIHLDILFLQITFHLLCFARVLTHFFCHSPTRALLVSWYLHVNLW